MENLKKLIINLNIIGNLIENKICEKGTNNNKNNQNDIKDN